MVETKKYEAMTLEELQKEINVAIRRTLDAADESDEALDEAWDYLRALDKVLKQKKREAKDNGRN